VGMFVNYFKYFLLLFLISCFSNKRSADLYLDSELVLHFSKKSFSIVAHVKDSEGNITDIYNGKDINLKLEKKQKTETVNGGTAVFDLRFFDINSNEDLTFTSYLDDNQNIKSEITIKKNDLKIIIDQYSEISEILNKIDCKTSDIEEKRCIAFVKFAYFSGYESLENNQICSLRGVTCEGENKKFIIKIFWKKFGLNGFMYESVNELKDLKTLVVSRNSLSGKIPDLSELKNLKELGLWDNDLIGHIPKWIDKLKKLEIIALAKNKLTGIIPYLGSLSNLKELHLWGNNLTGEIPNSINKLKKLKKLYIWDNNLSGPIPNLNDSVEILAARGNNLNLPKIKKNKIDCKNSDIQEKECEALVTVADVIGYEIEVNNICSKHIVCGCPDGSDISFCENKKKIITELDFTGLGLNGQISPKINELTNLHSIYFANNNLTGQIPNLNNLSKLMNLNLADNKLIGDIPDLKKLNILSYIYLNKNKLIGSLSKFHLDSAISIDISDNKFHDIFTDLVSKDNKSPYLIIADLLHALIIDDRQIARNIEEFEKNISYVKSASSFRSGSFRVKTDRCKCEDGEECVIFDLHNGKVMYQNYSTPACRQKYFFHIFARGWE
jgi:Leucine-rich repeat (LRR) protein